MYWGAAKCYTRNHCNYTWVDLQKIVLQVLNSINIIIIRKFAQKLWWYMELYHVGLTEKLAEYACKKFKSYRQILQNKLALFIKK